MLFFYIVKYYRNILKYLRLYINFDLLTSLENFERYR